MNPAPGWMAGAGCYGLSAGELTLLFPSLALAVIGIRR